MPGPAAPASATVAARRSPWSRSTWRTWGSFDGDLTLNTTDYTEAELAELAASGDLWDFTPGTAGRGTYDVVDRGQVRHRPGDPDTEWAYVCTGTFELPPEERPFTAVFAGGRKTARPPRSSAASATGCGSPPATTPATSSTTTATTR